MKNPLTAEVLRFLLESPEFDLKTYPWSNDTALNAPVPQRALPSGPAHVTLQYMRVVPSAPDGFT